MTTVRPSHQHTDEEHHRESEELFLKLMPMFDGMCQTSVMAALARCHFECLAASYQAGMRTREQVSIEIAWILDMLMKNFASLYDEEDKQEEVQVDVPSGSTKH